MKIWDLHAHLTARGSTPEEVMELLVRTADRVGIERICVYMGMSFKLTPTPEELRRQNDQVLRAIARFPDRAFGFVYLNPNYLEVSLEELNRCVAEGPMVGVKLWVATRASSPKLDPIVERAAELDAVIFQHTWDKLGGDPAQSGGGNLPGESTVQDLVELATRYPDYPFVMGHAGGDWQRGVRAVRAHENILVGVAGGDPERGMVEMAVRELGAERVLYGSDVAGRSFGSQLAKVYGARISEEERELIFSGNLRRLMRPILARKGML